MPPGGATDLTGLAVARAAGVGEDGAVDHIDAPDLEPLPVLSHAVRVGDTVYCSGQVPLRADGSLVEDDIGAMTRQAVANLEQVLAAAGATIADVVRTNVYLTDMADYAAMNEAYAALFADRPARTCVQVAGLPMGARVEIDCIAVRGSG
jgi:2-iminobutanoate/2-iminopropanoate deaminase